MQLTDLLATTDAPVVADLTAHAVGQAGWNNQPTWDNWTQSPAPWSNAPTWDNWSKSK
ncbi:multiple cyclophane-containing RiPP AmcA [Streptacidiphilus melanogenes]|uniref:multiple cyclophane-containing RiPP AmcA n=1 Tax=Streptacidiphilus melanogenes TaxID=411235 RepID=UPI000A651960|nr:multiple cyclophane-containing RiPP AmcA [Streptacidiphilus melanogenes]